MDMQGNLGPNHYSVKIGLIFITLGMNIVKFTDNN